MVLAQAFVAKGAFVDLGAKSQLPFVEGWIFKDAVKGGSFFPLQKGLDLPTNLTREVTNGNQGGLDKKMWFFL